MASAPAPRLTLYGSHLAMVQVEGVTVVCRPEQLGRIGAALIAADYEAQRPGLPAPPAIASVDIDLGRPCGPTPQAPAAGR